MRWLGIIDKPTKLAFERDLVGRLAPRRKFLVIDKPTKLAFECNLVGRLAVRRKFLIIDKPTKLASEHDLVGRLAARREFLINDKPTKPASENDLVGRLAVRREFLIIDKPTKPAFECVLVGRLAPRSDFLSLTRGFYLPAYGSNLPRFSHINRVPHHYDAIPCLKKLYLALFSILIIECPGFLPVYESSSPHHRASSFSSTLRELHLTASTTMITVVAISTTEQKK